MSIRTVTFHIIERLNEIIERIVCVNNLRAYIELTLAMIIVGSSVVVGKLVTSNFPVFLASSLRFGIASLILVPLLFKLEKNMPKLETKDKLHLILQTITGVFGFSIFLLIGLKYTTASESGIITSTTPAVIGLISFAFLKEKLKWNKVTGILITVCGVIIINVAGNLGQSEKGDKLLLGNLLVFCAVICEALFTIFGKIVSKKMSSLAISTSVTVLGFLMFFPFSIYQSINFDFTKVPISAWISIIYYAIVVTVIGFFLWYQGVSKVQASTSAVFTGILPISSLVLSYTILKEPFLPIHIVGILFVLVGILFISKTGDRSA